MTRGIFGNGSQKKTAKPLVFAQMSGLRGLGGAAGLGDVVPWQCWDKPGFKDGHAQNFAKAATYCKGLDPNLYGGDINACIGETTDALDWDNLVPKLCPPVKVSGGITWRNSTPNASVKKLQADLNVYMKKNGFDLLAVDGLLGSGTCGAANFIDQLEGTTFYRDYQLDKVCQTGKVPTKGGKPVTTVAVTPQVTITPGGATVAQMNLPWDTVSADTAEVQRILNTQLDSADMNQIAVTSKLDAPTCGAMRWQKNTQGIDMLSQQGKLCQGFIDPTKKIKVATPVVVKPPSDVLPTGPTTAPPKTSLASTTTMGLLAAVGAVGIYWYGKKSNWF